MLRPSLAFVGLVAFGTAAQAQQVPPSKLEPVTGTVRDAGIFHVATNTWTRKSTAAHIGADVIYDNTFSTGYYSALSGDHYVDEGRLPSPSSPANVTSRPGCSTIYDVDGFQIAYCTDQVGGGAFQVSFFETYVPCSTVIGVTPTATFLTAGPGGGVGGQLQCWIVTVDLDGPPSTGFHMLADGDGTFANPVASNLFGWSMSSALPAANQLATGPLIAGDPNLSLFYDGTRWDSPVNYAESGTGMGSMNQYRFEGGPTPGSCFWFGGIPFASFHLELYADACSGYTNGILFCSGDGTGTACPCSNNGVTGNGCANSLFAAGAHIGGAGFARITNDSLLLTTMQTPNQSVLFFQGTIRQAAGAGLAFGDGKRCAGGTVIRLGIKIPVGNTASYPVGADLPIHAQGQVTTPGTRTYQGWYRNPAAFCTPATFNLTNGIEFVWTP